MPAAIYDFEIEQGAEFVQPFIYKDSTGAPVNLTGISARMQVRQSISALTFYVELTTANGRLVIDPLLGKITIVLTSEETADFEWRRGVYDLELYSSPDDAIRFLSGQITVSREVTR